MNFHIYKVQNFLLLRFIELVQYLLQLLTQFSFSPIKHPFFVHAERFSIISAILVALQFLSEPYQNIDDFSNPTAFLTITKLVKKTFISFYQLYEYQYSALEKVS